ncbi:MAG TPA: hypothetical protein VGI54_05040 [Solirubrobacteraceae bacterium]
MPINARPRLAASFAAAAASAGMLTAAPAAQAAPPANDNPAAPDSFQPVTAENGQPSDLQAIAELAEATPDAGVPKCLGPTSFARTVWYSIPAAAQTHEITVEASGRTLDRLDLAAFVQPLNANPSTPSTAQPNVCAGNGSGGADAAEEPTSGVSLTVPGGHPVLIQVGRRGRPGSQQDEEAVVSLDDEAVAASPSQPPGDQAGLNTPGVRAKGDTIAPLFGATITQEDPAEPPCPSLGSVWRVLKPDKSHPGPRLITANGADVSTLTVFGSPSPTSGNALDCVNRSGTGSLQMLIPAAKTKKPLWIRLGTDAPSDGATGSLRAGPGAGTLVVDGGPGGFDPTAGGPGGGFPSDCAKADASHAAVTGAAFAGNLKRLNKRGRFTLGFTLKRGPVCDAEVQLSGPRGRVYATAQAIRLKTGRRFVSLARGRALARGRYTLTVTGLDRLGNHVRVPGKVGGKLG